MQRRRHVEKPKQDYLSLRVDIFGYACLHTLFHLHSNFHTATAVVALPSSEAARGGFTRGFCGSLFTILAKIFSGHSFDSSQKLTKLSKQPARDTETNPRVR